MNDKIKQGSATEAFTFGMAPVPPQFPMLVISESHLLIYQFHHQGDGRWSNSVFLRGNWSKFGQSEFWPIQKPFLSQLHRVAILKLSTTTVCCGFILFLVFFFLFVCFLMLILRHFPKAWCQQYTVNLTSECRGSSNNFIGTGKSISQRLCRRSTNTISNYCSEISRKSID